MLVHGHTYAVGWREAYGWHVQLLPPRLQLPELDLIGLDWIFMNPRHGTALATKPG